MAIALIKQTVGQGVSAANQTITATSTAGSLLMLIYSRSGGLATGTVTSVTDTAGNTWTLVTRGSVSGAQHTRIEAWVCPNAAAITSLTVNSGTAQTNSWNVLEFTGAATASPVDAASPDNSGLASTTTVTTVAVTVTDPADMVVAATHFAQTTTTGPTPAGWTALTDWEDAAVGSSRGAYRLPAATGSQGAVTWTLTAARTAGVVTVAVKPLNTAQTATPNGVPAGAATGTPTATPGAVTATPNGAPLAAAAGTPTITGTATVTAIGVTVAAAMGVPAVTAGTVTVTPAGVPAATAAGVATVTAGTATATPNGVPVAAAAGTATVTTGTVTATATPDGLPVPVAAGTPTAAAGPATAAPAGVTTTVTVGAPTVTGTITATPGGLPAPVAVGAPAAAAQAPSPSGPAGHLTTSTQRPTATPAAGRWHAGAVDTTREVSST